MRPHIPASRPVPFGTCRESSPHGGLNLNCGPFWPLCFAGLTILGAVRGPTGPLPYCWPGFWPCISRANRHPDALPTTPPHPSPLLECADGHGAASAGFSFSLSSPGSICSPHGPFVKLIPKPRSESQFRFPPSRPLVIATPVLLSSRFFFFSRPLRHAGAAGVGLARAFRWRSALCGPLSTIFCLSSQLLLLQPLIGGVTLGLFFDTSPTVHSVKKPVCNNARVYPSRLMNWLINWGMILPIFVHHLWSLAFPGSYQRAYRTTPYWNLTAHPVVWDCLKRATIAINFLYDIFLGIPQPQALAVSARPIAALIPTARTARHVLFNLLQSHAVRPAPRSSDRSAMIVLGTR